jgi:arylsulfatase A-like enzyme
LAGAAGTALAAQTARPNLIIIYCDDLGYADLGCFGNRVIETPNLDRMAKQGTRFTDLYSVSPVCTPSRAALMTGQYPQRFGIHHADLPESLPRYPLPATAVTLPQVLHDAGYYTAHVGKWHLGEPPEAPEPRKRGYDYFYGCFGGRPSSPWIKYARSIDPEMIENEGRPQVVKGHVTDIQTDGAIRALQQTPKGKPFFLNLWYNAPHEPLAPLVHQAEKYRHWSAEEQTYFQTVTDMDRGVGRIRKVLDELGVAGNTMILFSSDNGPETHNSKYARGAAWPLKGMKTQLWEGGIRVPGILHWPGRVPEGQSCATPVSMLDVFPTYLQAAGAKAPANWKLDGGQDLVAIANRKSPGADRSIFFEFHFAQRGVEASLPMAVRKGKWKLFSDHKFERVQLYDLSTDIGEQYDVAQRNPATTKSLLAELRAWWLDAGKGVDVDRKGTRVEPPSPEELEKRYYKN